MNEEDKKIENSKFLVKDLVQGDESVSQREDFSILTPEEIKRAFDLILNNKHFDEKTKQGLLTNSYKLIYKDKPPTWEDFTSPKWIGEMSDSLFPYWKQLGSQLFSAKTSYKNCILYTPIGTGKSSFTALVNLYISVIIYYMRHPKKTLGQSNMTSICNVFIAQSLEKATEVLLEPFINILNTSEIFERCRTLDIVKRKEKEYGTSKICWTTAGRSSALSIGSNMSIKIKSSIASLLGLTILCGSITELAFFKDAGYSDEEILRIYNDLKGRIFSRFPKKNGLNFSILDSSPNDATFESSIDYWILNKAPENKENIIFNDRKWNLQPWLFEEWSKDKSKVFYIHLGTQANRIPKVYENYEEVKNFDSRDVIECPIDGLQLALDDTAKFCKDYAGIPTSSPQRLLQDNVKIEAVFDKGLHNIYSHLIALDFENPEELIWNSINNDFFVHLDKIYEFYRNPNEERFVSVDQSISGDTACIAVTHPELNLEGEIIDVADMTIALIPHKGRINLDAIKFFIYDLRRLGRLNIKHVSFDQFQSESTMQFLSRNDFDVERLSVDISTVPYLNMVQSINTGRLIMGRNIYMKNNLKSLKLTKLPSGKHKVDHEKGKVENSLNANDNWETSALGFNAKDVSDAVCASIELRKKYYVGTPRYVYKSIQIEEEIRNKEQQKSLKKYGMLLKK